MTEVDLYRMNVFNEMTAKENHQILRKLMKINVLNDYMAYWRISLVLNPEIVDWFNTYIPDWEGQLDKSWTIEMPTTLATLFKLTFGGLM